MVNPEPERMDRLTFFLTGGTGTPPTIERANQRLEHDRARQLRNLENQIKRHQEKQTKKLAKKEKKSARKEVGCLGLFFTGRALNKNDKGRAGESSKTSLPTKAPNPENTTEQPEESNVAAPTEAIVSDGEVAARADEEVAVGTDEELPGGTDK